jgi:hypothetical protein
MEFSSHAVDDVLQVVLQKQNRINRRSLWKGISFTGGWLRCDVVSHVQCEVVLAKFLLLPKPVCQAFMDYTAISWRALCLWNGEDFFVNLVANHLGHVPAGGPLVMTCCVPRVNRMQNPFMLPDAVACPPTQAETALLGSYEKNPRAT